MHNGGTNKTGPRGSRLAGFTIIEVLIVLAIAGLILMIVFLAVPRAQRSERDNNRRIAVKYIFTEMGQYYTNNKRYPFQGPAYSDDRAAFEAGLEAEGPSEKFDVRYEDNNTNREYPFSGPGSPSSPLQASDTISIAHANVCQRSPGFGPGSANFPIKVGAGGVADYRTFVVWVYLEGKAIYCVDSAS